ncbi:MAG: asparagine synthase (glutamine-hydrolyzing) [Phycisphaeraceae bacterium]|nr:asparagine synthase (glutamine-hydrolyzing) [Phycisphaeraceae bacterium]
MCGINGIIDLQGSLGAARLEAMCIAMRDGMLHRGPDDAGVWTSPDGRVSLGHRRLSIIDLRPEGRQPMGNEDGTVQVVFNGEIYGFQPLRAELERQGHLFRSRSDTEVLPHLFESMAPESIAAKVNQLDGMFAFAAWNRREGRLLLARDPFGKKPLYWSCENGLLAFSSELHCFQALPGFRGEVDRDALAEYLMLQYVHAPRSIWRGVHKLEAGSYALIDLPMLAERGAVSGASVAESAPRSEGVRATPAPAIRSQRYWRFEAVGPLRRPSGLSEADEVEHLRTLLLAAVEKRLMSDVPLGAFLSGGVDSSLVVAMIRKELGRPIDSFSIGFGGTRDTEHEFARETAALLGTTHRDEVLEPDAVELVQQIAGELDEPNGDSSCLPTWLLCRFARQFVTVAISGDGGDELFGGYGRYRDTINEQGFGPARWRAKVIAMLRGRHASSPADAYLSPRWLIWMPEEITPLIGSIPAPIAEELAEWRALLDGSQHPLLHRMRTLDANTYMPGAVLAKVDRMSMRHSLEVRSPLLDKAVAGFAMGLSEESCWRPPDETKRILKTLAGRYLPESWMRRRKMGFGLPSNAWSAPTLVAMARDLLLSGDGQVAALVDRSNLSTLVQRQADPQNFSIYRLWPLLVLELWLRRMHAPAGHAPAPRTAAAAHGHLSH